MSNVISRWIGLSAAFVQYFVTYTVQRLQSFVVPTHEEPSAVQPPISIPNQIMRPGSTEILIPDEFPTRQSSTVRTYPGSSRATLYSIVDLERSESTESETFSTSSYWQLPKCTTDKDSNFIAIVIGIDNYIHIDPLRGCVADADDMTEYLINTLHVSPSRITNLRNEEASATRIKKTISDLTINDCIQKDDPIVIFFAGHGARTRLPPDRPNGKMIEMILPVGFQPVTNEVEDCQGIPDRTLGYILSNVARAKGNNITVIFDCCYSGSSTRDVDSSPELGIRERGIELGKDYRILSSILPKNKSETTRASDVGSLKSAMGSHVLVAACSQSMKAHESFDHKSGKIRGDFTRVLLQFLRDNNVERATMTYTELIKGLPDLPKEQYPQCEGDNRDRILFNKKAPKRGRPSYVVSEDSKGIITLHAGDVEGITENTVLDIFTQSDTTGSVGQVRVSKVQTTFSSLERIPDHCSFHIPVSARAIMVKAGDDTDIFIAVPHRDPFESLIRALNEKLELQLPAKFNIRLVNHAHQHDLAINFERDDVIFDINDPVCLNVGLNRIPHTVPRSNIDHIYSILISAADFFYHLHRSPKQSGKNKFTLDTYRLEESRTKWHMPFGNKINLAGSDTITVVADSRTHYGFKFINHSAINLYIWAFMFDMSSLQIRCIHCPGTAKAREKHVNPVAGAGSPADASVEAGGELAIGYGNHESNGEIFAVGDGQKADVSYLKLFITHRYVDLSFIEQDCPFNVLGRASRINRISMPTELWEWDTVRLTIIQRHNFHE